MRTMTPALATGCHPHAWTMVERPSPDDEDKPGFVSGNSKSPDLDFHASRERTSSSSGGIRKRGGKVYPPPPSAAAVPDSEGSIHNDSDTTSTASTSCSSPCCCCCCPSPAACPPEHNHKTHDSRLGDQSHRHGDGGGGSSTGAGQPPSSSAAPSAIRAWGDDWGTTRYPRLSKPVEVMRHSYDVVVIGSGYGGGVAASRLARAGKQVCLLERGKERWPGEYPETWAESMKQVHVSGEVSGSLGPLSAGLPTDGGDPTGMFHLHLGKGQSAVVGNGLGGTSLMNANIFLEADRETLRTEMWPKEIRDEPEELDQYYTRASSMLQPNPYPQDWPGLPKLNLLQRQAEALGLKDKFRRPPQTTRFQNGPNAAGVEMKPSTLAGQDCTGINDGSKSSTLVTYVADAWNWGAEMFCECEVRHVSPSPQGGWLIHYAWHGRNRAHFKENLYGDLMWVHAREAVFLAAGALGTTEILMRSRDVGGLDGSSPELGKNMSGNGDMLAFGYNTDSYANSMGRANPSPYDPVGPCISGAIDNRRGHPNPLDGYVIQEGAVPGALAPFLQAVLDLQQGATEPKGLGLMGRARAALARLGSRFMGPYYRPGAMAKTQVYLVMSHDSNQAFLSLQDDKPLLQFVGVERSGHARELGALLEKATRAVGGTLMQNPFTALLGQEVTVHPIGGCSMARDGTGSTGVVNHVGEVFSGSGTDTHSGLVVVDGAMVPTALGVNPLATITALAERAVQSYCDKKGLAIDWTPNGLLDLFGEPKRAPNWAQKSERQTDRLKAEEVGIKTVSSLMRQAERAENPGFGFTEVMSGFLHRDPGESSGSGNGSGSGSGGGGRHAYELAYRIARNGCESARFFLSVQTFDTRAMVREPDHPALLTGTFVCPTIPGSPFMVHRGRFNLFSLDSTAPGTRNMTYDFDMTGVDGRIVHFHGYKVVDSSVVLAPTAFWRATTTLYVTIRRISQGAAADGDGGKKGKRRQGSVLAKGIMHIKPSDFASQVLSMTPTGSSSMMRKMWSATSFLTYMTQRSISLLLAPLTPLQYPSATYAGYVNDTPPTRSVVVVASDGVETRMHVWEPTSLPADPAGKVLPVENLLMIPGAAVDHQIFALPTIPYNAVNYFRRAGYRVFVSVHRMGMVRAARNGPTTYSARLDLAACLAHIRNRYPRRGGGERGRRENKVYVNAHCMGSVAFSTGLLDGTIPGSWVLGVTCSQTFMNPVWGPANVLKVRFGPVPADVLYRRLAGDWLACSPSPDDRSLVQRALDQVLRVMPDNRAELCNSAACHRCTLVFGRCWNHGNLNEATHRQIDRFFSGVHMTLLHMLMKQGAAGGVTTDEPNPKRLDTVENVKTRLVGIPFLLWVGADNAVLSREATLRTYETLIDVFGRGGRDGKVQYRRKVVPGYGHLDGWMGRNAWKDVYPMVREEVDRVTRGEEYVFVEPHDEFRRMVETGELS